jgi:hypothetical protein
MPCSISDKVFPPECAAAAFDAIRRASLVVDIETGRPGEVLSVCPSQCTLRVRWDDDGKIADILAPYLWAIA